MPEFTYRAAAGGKVLISWRGRVVTTLAGTEAAKFLERAAAVNAAAALQLLLARATRNFKRGNERGRA